MSNLSTFVKRIRDIMRNDAGINGDAQRIEQMAWMLFLKVYDTKETDWEIDEDDYTSIIPESCRWRNWAVDDKSGNAMTGDTLLAFVNNTLLPVLKGQDVLNADGTIKVEGVKVHADTPIKKSIVQATFEDTNNYMKDGVLLRQIINIIDEIDLEDYEESHAFGEIYENILKELQSAGSSGEFYTPRAVTEFMAKMINPQIDEKVADFACGTGGFLTSWLKELETKVQTVEDREKLLTSIYGIEKKQFPYILCITNMLLHDIDVPKIYHDNSLLRDVLDYTERDQFDVILMNPPYGGHEKNEVKNHFPSDLASSETADLFMSVIMYRLKKNGRAAVILPDGFLFGTDNAKVSLKKKLLSEFNLHTVIRMPHSVFAPYTSITTNIALQAEAPEGMYPTHCSISEILTKKQLLLFRFLSLMKKQTLNLWTKCRKRIRKIKGNFHPKKSLLLNPEKYQSISEIFGSIRFSVLSQIVVGNALMIWSKIQACFT